MQHLKIVSEYNAYIVITFDIATAYVTGLIAKKILSLVVSIKHCLMNNIYIYIYIYILYSICHICVGPSAPPQNINTVVISSTAISVSWYPPSILDQNGDIIGYQLIITNQNRTNSSAIVVNITNVTSYIATMLEEFEVYSFEIAAETAIGLGPFSDAVNNQTFEDG